MNARLARLEHPENAPSPIFWTLAGMINVEMPVQPANALPSIVVTVSGSVMLVMKLQFWKAPAPIALTEFPSIAGGISMPVRVLPFSVRPLILRFEMPGAFCTPLRA